MANYRDAYKTLLMQRLTYTFIICTMCDNNECVDQPLHRDTYAEKCFHNEAQIITLLHIDVG